MTYHHLTCPWASRSQLYAAPGSMILKLALGEAPEDIPAAADIRRHVQAPAVQTRIRSIDRVLNHFAERVRISRVHTAAAHNHAGPCRGQFDDLEHTLGLSRTFQVDAHRACCIDDLVDALRQVAVVEQAHRHYLCTAPFTVGETVAISNAEAWAARQQIGAVEALAYEAGDPSIVIAVVDTGVVQVHRELQRRLRPGLDTVQLTASHVSSTIELTGDVSDSDRDPEDNVGHGTSCAAIIAAEGLAMPPGLAGDCRVLPVRVLGAARFPGKTDLSGVGALADIDRGVKAAVDLGARIINMSFGTPESELDPYDPIPHQDVVRYAAAHGCVMIAASGNAGGQARYSPASLDEVIAVSAVDAEGRPAPFSTGGDHVDIAAPGVRILSAGLNGYQLATGTSFAAPFVAAAAGLLVSRAAGRAYPLDAPTVKRLLRESAAPWPQADVHGQGAGILDAHAALRHLDRFIDREEREAAVMAFGRAASFGERPIPA